MTSDSEVMTVILKYLMSNASNKVFVEKLKVILHGIEGRKHIEERNHYRYQSIILFGYNIFPFSIEEYREMAKLIQGDTYNDE